MSRCFPFPPPGYEKKARTNDVDFLKKEKHGEKKHKKEKREKEKKDSKEKREKDRSEGKDREKKNRKEKHRDKKKDQEDRDKDKDKKGTSDEKKLTGKSEGRNGEILGQKEEDMEKGKNSSSNEKSFSGKFTGDNGEKLSQNSHLSEEIKDSKFVQELGRRISDGDRGAGNQSVVEKFMGTDRKTDEAVVRLVAKDIVKWGERKEKNKDTKGDDRRMDVQRSMDEAESSGNTMLHNVPGFVQAKFERIPLPLEKNIGRKMEGKDKAKKKESDDKRGDKVRDKDREKKSQGRDKNRDKEKKKEEKVKEKSELKSAEHDKFKEGEKNDHISSHINKMSDLSKDSDMADAIEGNLRKRKDLEANGFFHATEIRPNKLPRPPSSHSSHPLIENGRVLEPCQTPMKFTSNRQGVASNHIVDKKKQKVNGMIEGLDHSVSASSTKPASTAEAVKIAKSSMKPPHPDSKYLGEILSVPKMEEWSDFDDQEWLLGSNETLLNKPKVGDSGVTETPLVWEEAVQIDSADICALPYVIPY